MPPLVVAVAAAAASSGVGAALAGTALALELGSIGVAALSTAAGLAVPAIGEIYIAPPREAAILTIINVFIERDRALIGADVEMVLGDGTVGRCTKLLALPHMSAIITGRGSVVFLQAAFNGAMLTRSFDELAAQLQPWLAELGPQLAKSVGAHASSLERQQIVILGWSDSAARMVGRVFTQIDAAAGFEVADIPEYALLPWEPEFGPPIVPSSPAAIRTAAAVQAPWIAQTTGGSGKAEMVIAAVTKTSVTIEAA